MRIDILTTFTEMFPPVLDASILGRAAQKGILEFNLCDIRQYSENKHHNTDDYPFGGGAGMVMLAQPIYSCLDAVDPEHKARRILLSPRGRTLSPEVARELAKEEHLLFLCGHYEGIDERVNYAMDEDLSIGDYVLTGGELAAMVAIDCIARFIPGVLGSSESAETESFSDGLLEYPQYTRPAEFRGMKVPEVLLNGNHALIERWRRDRAIELTLSRRPELMEHVELNKKDIAFIQSIKKDEKAR